MSQICICHGSWAVMTCAKLWSDWIFIFNIRLTYILRYLHYELINSLCYVSHGLCATKGSMSGVQFASITISKIVFVSNLSIWYDSRVVMTGVKFSCESVCWIWMILTLIQRDCFEWDGVNCSVKDLPGHALEILALVIGWSGLISLPPLWRWVHEGQTINMKTIFPGMRILTIKLKGLWSPLIL